MGKEEKEAISVFNEMRSYLRVCPFVRGVNVEFKLRHKKGEVKQNKPYFKILGLDDSGIRVRLCFGSYYDNVTIYIGEVGTEPTTAQLEELKKYLKNYQI